MSSPDANAPKTPQQAAHEEVRRLREEEKSRAERNHKLSDRLLWTLVLLLITSAALYIAAHMYWPPKKTLWCPNKLVQLDDAGRVCHISETDIRWYLGRDETTALAASMKQRSEEIDQLEDKIVRQALLEFQVRFSGAGDLSSDARSQITNFAAAARAGNFSEAADQFNQILSGWTEATRQFAGENNIFDLNYGLEELARLKDQQTHSLKDILQPPAVHQIFWMNPALSLLECVWWAFFGTIVNLLVNISQARADGRFSPDEKWICLSKLVYGPILSSVLIMAIYFGMLNPGTEVRFWFLPLAGFLFGYHTRKTAVLIDKLGTKLLGNVNKSIDELGQAKAQAAGHAADAIMAKTKPRNFTELKQQAVIVADTAITTAVLKQQSTT